MKKSIGAVILAFVFPIVLLGGCLPVSTPAPTADAAPILYHAAVDVVDGDGKPIARARIMQGETVEFTDDQGLWQSSSQSPELSIKVWALGYLLQEKASTLQAGENKIQIQLSADPFVLRVSDFIQNKDKKRWTPFSPYCLCSGASIDEVGLDTPLDPCPPDAPCPED